MPSATARNAPCTCHPAPRPGSSRSWPTCSRTSAHMHRCPSSAFSRRSHAGRHSGRRSSPSAAGTQPSSCRRCAGCAPRDSPSPSPRSDRRRRPGAPMHARSECRVSAIDLTPIGRLPMRSNASPERIAALLAASFLEAAWITLAYVLIESLTRAAAAPLSILAFAAAALAGTVFARGAARGDPHAHRSLLAVIAIAVGLIGWLLPLGAAAADFLEDPATVFAMHPGGILLGLAFVRGAAHRTDLDDERIAEAALGPGLAAMAGLWVLLAASGGTTTAWVVNVATWATVTFVATGLLSIGLARLADLRGAGVRGTDRRIWDGVLVGVVVGLLVVA